MSSSADIEALRRSLLSAERAWSSVSVDWRDEARSEFERTHWRRLHMELQRAMSEFTAAEAELQKAEECL